MKSELLLCVFRDVVEDEVGMLDALLTGKVSAFVLDANFVEYVAGHNVSGMG